MLGRIDVLDDRAVLEVNSSERLELAKEWLLALPGVHLDSSAARAEEMAFDDILPSPEERPTPEMIEAVLGMTEKMLLANLDRPVPMFDDRTPREHARTPQGRREVELWIHRMPPIVVPGGLGAGPARVPTEGGSASTDPPRRRATRTA